MKILFCNIAYMFYYEGHTGRDITPTGAGKWVEEHGDAHEKWNFLNYDGMCYGFVMSNGTFRIERFDGVPENALQTDGVTIIWCAPKKDDKTVIVGWYENAMVYREVQLSMCTRFTGLDREYFAQAKAQDCYLLPEDLITFEIGRASVAGQGKGFGQQNYWYAESRYAREKLIPSVMEFINKHKEDRINKTDDFFEPPANVNVPLTDREEIQADDYFRKEDYGSYLPLGYRSFHNTKSVDEAYSVCEALIQLFQFSKAIKWCNKIVELEGETTWDVALNLTFLYGQTEEHEKAIENGKRLLDYPQVAQEEIRSDIYITLADSYRYNNEIEEGIKWLDKTLEESTNKELVANIKSTRQIWIDSISGI